jgi:hypothetical protein
MRVEEFVAVSSYLREKSCDNSVPSVRRPPTPPISLPLSPATVSGRVDLGGCGPHHRHFLSLHSTTFLCLVIPGSVLFLTSVTYPSISRGTHATSRRPLSTPKPCGTASAGGALFTSSHAVLRTAGRRWSVPSSTQSTHLVLQQGSPRVHAASSTSER